MDDAVRRVPVVRQTLEPAFGSVTIECFSPKKFSTQKKLTTQWKFTTKNRKSHQGHLLHDAIRRVPAVWKTLGPAFKRSIKSRLVVKPLGGWHFRIRMCRAVKWLVMCLDLIHLGGVEESRTTGSSSLGDPRTCVRVYGLQG